MGHFFVICINDDAAVEKGDWEQQALSIHNYFEDTSKNMYLRYNYYDNKL